MRKQSGSAHGTRLPYSICVHLACFVLIIAACVGEDRAATNKTVTTTTTADTLPTEKVAKAAEPAPSASPIIDTVPSSVVTSYDDSILATTTGDHPVVTSRGDTIRWTGGTMFNVDSTKQYGAEEYTKNGTHYLRVVLQIGNRPNGKAINVTKARVRLPPMGPDEELILEGLCRVDGVRDPRILGIATVPEHETFGPAHYAWRFDPVTESLSGIPASNVTCDHVVGED